MSIRHLPFLDVFEDASGGNIKTLNKDFLEDGKIPVIDQGQSVIAGYVNDPAKVCKSKPPVIVFGDHTKAIKYVDFPFAMGADGTKVLVPKEGGHAKYLFYALRTLHIPDAGYSRHYKFLKETTIPLPPLAEQKRIAAILDAADALRAKRREALAQLDALLQSSFLTLFGDPVTNPMGWPLHSLKELGKVKTGGTPPSAKTGMFDGPIPFITPGDLGSGHPAKRSVTEAGAAEAEIVRAGATFVCCIGATIEKMGKAEVLSSFNQQINAVEWSKNIDDEYGLGVLTFFKAQIAKAGASTTLPILKKSSFEKIEIPLPPLPLQQKFATIVESIERQKTTQRAHLAELDALFAALQHRAFRREL